MIDRTEENDYKRSVYNKKVIMCSGLRVLWCTEQ